MERQLIKDLKDKDGVDSLYLVKEKNLALGKNGRLYMSLKLGDKTGNIDSRLWDNVEDISRSFEVGDIVKIRGQVQVYQSRRQLVVHRLERVETDNVDFEEFILTGEVNVEDMWAKLVKIFSTIRNPHLKILVASVLEDPEIKPLLMKAPAAKTIHHAWQGGLLEHILSISQTMEFMAQHYSFLNRDLLLFGALFHDIGKIWELSYENQISYTDRGRLIGHMEIACELIDKKIQKIFGFPEELRDLCKHIILSHHGKLEYGSPKRPKFIEAYIVSMIDELDSKVSTLRTMLSEERQEGQKWSKYSEMFDRYFLVDDLKAKYEVD